MIPGSANSLLLKSAAAGGAYSIPRSLRFNSSDSAFCSRVPGSAGNRTTWTWAGWVKRSALGARQGLFGAYENPNYTYLEFTSGDILQIESYSSSPQFLLSTSQVFRDCSAWYHIVLTYDSTQATSSNRIKLYINGTQVTTFTSASYPSPSYQSAVNSTNPHDIGRYPNISQYYLNGYLADIHFIDGQALTPSSFGEFDATTGVWNPKAYSGGSYGTNGFHLPFSDNSAATAAALGKDSAGSNNWTPNNLSVTAGSGNDSLVDTPTNGTASSGGDAGGTVVGNYATLNPLDKNASITPTNGNLDIVGTGPAHRPIRATVGMSSGKWYWEATVTSYSSGLFGIAKADASLADGQYVGANASSWGYIGNGTKYTNGSASSYGASFTTGDVIGIAFDADNGTLTFYKNGISQGSAFTGLTSGPYFPAVSTYFSNDSYSFNFGQRPFAYAAPANYKSLNTANLPTPTILNGSSYFDTKLYTGNGSTQTISGLAFSPDWVWIKNRSTAQSHTVYDIIRGATKALVPNTTDSELTLSNFLTAFTSDGFSVGNDNNPNGNGNAIVAWCWDAGTSTVSNTQGSITSSVRANASAGFSVVTYTGSGANSTIGHGLGVAPQMIITKNRSSGAFNWGVYHASAGNSVYGKLNLADAFSSLAIWQNTTPSSTVFYVGNYNAANQGADNYVAYCFAPVSGYSSAFSYTGNGSSDGPMVWLGFRPKFLLIKRTDSTGNWLIVDSVRGVFNLNGTYLYANSSDAEATQSSGWDFLSNGLKNRNTYNDSNASGATYIGFAFAENPFSIARAR